PAHVFCNLWITDKFHLLFYFGSHGPTQRNLLFERSKVDTPFVNVSPSNLIHVRVLLPGMQRIDRCGTEQQKTPKQQFPFHDDKVPFLPVFLQSRRSAYLIVMQVLQKKVSTSCTPQA